MQIVFFRRPKPKQFEYKPRYYDEEEERLRKRREEMEKSGHGDTSFMQSEIDRRWRRLDKKNRSKSRGLTLLVYLVIAALLVYFIFFA
jgi:adenine-specific DNA methylase